MSEAMMRDKLDAYTREYAEARTSVICDTSGDITTDVRTLYERVNEDRRRCGLLPLSLPFWMGAGE